MNRSRQSVAAHPGSRGVTLVELMVSLLLGSLFSLTMTTVYLHSKRQFAHEEALARMQENGRFALQLLRRELAHAGFFGGGFALGNLSPGTVSRDCVSSGRWALDTRVALEWVNDFDSTKPTSMRTARGIEWTCVEPSTIKTGTDLLSVKRTAGSQTIRHGEIPSGAAVKNGQWYLRVAGFGEELSWFYHKRGGLPPADLGAAQTVDYWAYYAQIFYIRRYSEASGDDVPTLCVESLDGGLSLGAMSTRALVEGVEDMQVEFGFDTDLDGVPNHFHVATNPGNASPIVADGQAHIIPRFNINFLRHIGVVDGHILYRNQQFTTGAHRITRIQRKVHQR